MSNTMWLKGKYNHGGGSNRSKTSGKFKSITKKPKKVIKNK